jgi:uncharacterized small protein (TIGR04563 family)
MRQPKRTFTKVYKRRILKAVARCRGDGEVRALLERERLYSVYVTRWKRELGGGSRPTARRPAADPERSGHRTSVYLPLETCEEIQAEASRRGWSSSRMVQHAWALARDIISTIPSTRDHWRLE